MLEALGRSDAWKLPPKMIERTFLNADWEFKLSRRLSLRSLD